MTSYQLIIEVRQLNLDKANKNKFMINNYNKLIFITFCVSKTYTNVSKSLTI